MVANGDGKGEERRGRHYDVRQGGGGGKGGGGGGRSKSQGAGRYEKRRKWDGRVEDRPFRYKTYCLNEEATAELGVVDHCRRHAILGGTTVLGFTRSSPKSSMHNR